MNDADRIPTLPRPAPMPREDAPTPIPRKSSLEELRASEEPPVWLLAIDELRAQLLERIEAASTQNAAAVDRASQADNAQQEKINELERWKREVEDNAKKAATLSGNIVTALDTLATKWLTPQTIAVAIGTAITVGSGIIATYLKSRGMLP